MSEEGTIIHTWAERGKTGGDKRGRESLKEVSIKKNAHGKG